MKQLIRFRPLEPYFFGGERSSSFGGERPGDDEGATLQAPPRYYIRSLDVPPQTTLFGALRFLLTKSTKREVDGSPSPRQHRSDWKPPVSYQLTESEQDFGDLLGISPLLLVDADHQYYIRTPLDHQKSEEQPETHYKPWTYDPSETLEVLQGEWQAPKEFDPKQGLADCWMRLSDLRLLTEEEDRDAHGMRTDAEKKKALELTRPIRTTTRIGVSTTLQVDGLFKMEYNMLRDGFEFAFVAELGKVFEIPQMVISLGQKKTSFLVSAEPLSDKAPDADFSALREVMDPHMAVAISDLYVNPDRGSLQALYQCCTFVCVKAHDHRSLITAPDHNALPLAQRFRKTKALVHLIAAGSVFRIRDEAALAEFRRILEEPHARMAGFNHVIYGKEWNLT